MKNIRRSLKSGLFFSLLAIISLLMTILLQINCQAPCCQKKSQSVNPDHACCTDKLVIKNWNPSSCSCQIQTNVFVWDKHRTNISNENSSKISALLVNSANHFSRNLSAGDIKLAEISSINTSYPGSFQINPILLI